MIECKDELPASMTSDTNCKRLDKSCLNLKNECTRRIFRTLGRSGDAKLCKKALGRANNKKVRNYCKKTCNVQCGKISMSIADTI